MFISIVILLFFIAIISLLFYDTITTFIQLKNQQEVSPPNSPNIHIN
jgi:hypothetical protein